MASNQSIEPQKRKPRYRRSSTGNLRLQDRDIEIIKQACKHRFLNSEHFKALIPGSNQGILRRLNSLFHNGYLDRPLEQIKPYKEGSESMIYALGNKGADLLNKEFGIPRAKVDWTSKNRDIKHAFLDHTLMVSHFMVCLELACRNNKKVELIEKKEVLEKEAPKGIKTTFKLNVSVPREFSGMGRTINIGVVPDNMFSINVYNDPPPAYFFLEADRSTMPIKRNKVFQSSYSKKMLCYYISWRDKIFHKNFGFKNPMVLTITKSQDRIESMIEACKEIDRRKTGLRMFLFAPASTFTLDHPEKILQKAWQNTRGETVSLLD